MRFYFQIIRVMVLLCCINAPSSFAADDLNVVPELLLANSYQSGIGLQNYWVSEKYDGVRAYWNGVDFISRQGNIFHAPHWFKKPLPEIALDGELWLGRGEFEALSGLVRQQSPDAADWHGIKFMVFDLPDDTGIFDQRLILLKKIISDINAPHILWVEQFKVSGHEALINLLDEVVAQGAEGLMLHLGSSRYKKGRSDDLLKLKKHFDAEAVVISYVPGKGKYKGMLGSLEVETTDKKRFKIGSGFSDAQRKSPPAIGATITYKYFGLTANGIPRFASFMRVRDDY